MEETLESQINHDKLSLLDRVSIVGELEHIRRHAIRSAKASEQDEDKLFYEVIAEQSKNLRRKYQKEYLNCDEKDWCLVKAAASLKQLFYEIGGDYEYLNDTENLADNILSHAFHQDLTNCEACAKDKNDV